MIYYGSCLINSMVTYYFNNRLQGSVAMSNKTSRSATPEEQGADSAPRCSIGFMMFPNMLQLDFTGPYGVFAQVPEATIHLIAKVPGAVVSGDGLTFHAGVGFADCPPLDMLVVPGGGGVEEVLSDVETVEFIRERASECRYVASVCTGALVLGAAGLLKGRRATTHWLSFELLRHFRATPVNERVVFDESVVTAAGVTSGIDMALAVVGRVWGDFRAEAIQLVMEYAPRPPYSCGSPEEASEEIVQTLIIQNAERQKRREVAVMTAAQKLFGECS